MPIKPQDSVIITRLILCNKCEINIGIIGIMFMKWKLLRFRFLFKAIIVL